MSCCLQTCSSLLVSILVKIFLAVLIRTMGLVMSMFLCQFFSFRIRIVLVFFQALGIFLCEIVHSNMVSRALKTESPACFQHSYVRPEGPANLLFNTSLMVAVSSFRVIVFITSPKALRVMESSGSGPCSGSAANSFFDFIRIIYIVTIIYDVGCVNAVKFFLERRSEHFAFVILEIVIPGPDGLDNVFVCFPFLE